MKLFLVAAILNPTEKDKEEGAIPEVVLDVTTVLAKDQNDAIVAAVGKIKAEIVSDTAKRSRLEVLARPFCG